MPRRSISTGRKWGSAAQKTALKKAQLISARKRRGTGDIDGGSNRRRRAASMDKLKATIRQNIEQDYIDRSNASEAKGKGRLKGHDVASRRLEAANAKREAARAKINAERVNRYQMAAVAEADSRKLERDRILAERKSSASAKKTPTGKKRGGPSGQAVAQRRAKKQMDDLKQTDARRRFQNAEAERAKKERPTKVMAKITQRNVSRETPGPVGGSDNRPFAKLSDTELAQGIQDTKKMVDDTASMRSDPINGSVMASAHRAAKENLADMKKELKTRKKKQAAAGVSQPGLRKTISGRRAAR